MPSQKRDAVSAFGGILYSFNHQVNKKRIQNCYHKHFCLIDAYNKVYMIIKKCNSTNYNYLKNDIFKNLNFKDL